VDITWDQMLNSDSSLSDTSILMTSQFSASVGIWDRAELDLRALGHLDDDWDDLGAISPKIELVDSASEFLRKMRELNPYSPPQRIVAGPVGEIVLEWHDSDGLLEIEIEEPGCAEITRVKSGVPYDAWTQNYGDDQERGIVWGSPEMAAHRSEVKPTASSEQEKANG